MKGRGIACADSNFLTRGICIGHFDKAFFVFDFAVIFSSCQATLYPVSTMYGLTIKGISQFADGSERLDASGRARSKIPHGDLSADHPGGRLHRAAVQDLRKSVG